ncbi:unnamed protein product [Adineta steineri]|uniref:Uncharacterized protein n=3 Tax=Adineta steineri TaxID=433720 RepID=A0A818PY07_9BILA|nr:unnamed protein product [Adineta steineri]
MTSMLYSPRHSIFYMNDIQDLLKNQSENSLITLATYPSSSTTTGSQYSNMRVTQRLHRYRSMKKQWQEVATFIQSNSSVSSTCTSSVLSSNVLPITQKSTIESKDYYNNDCINTTIAIKDINEGNSIDLDPLYSRIQQDLIKLRKIIKNNQNKFQNNNSLLPLSNIRSLTKTTSIPTIFNDQENNSIKDIKKASSLNNLKALDRVKISGYQMRSTKLPKSDSTDSGIGSNSSSTCSQYSKQQKPKRQNNSKTFNICNSRINPSPPPPPPPVPVPYDCSLHRTPHLSKKKPNISSKPTQNIRSKQNLPSRLSLLVPQMPTVVTKKKSSSFNVQDTRSPLTRQLTRCEDLTTRLYTYAASTSSATPCSMMLKRNTSLLPILIQSSSCIGIQPRDNHSTKLDYSLEEEEHKENLTPVKDNDDYYHLLDYKHLINRLPKSVISNCPRYGKDDYGILYDQLAHIRKKMPHSNIYDEYARNS